MANTLSLCLIACADLVSGQWLPHSLVGHNLTADAGPYSKLIFDPSWGTLGRILLLPATLQVVDPCTVPYCTNCTVSYVPDPRLWSFPVDPALMQDENISLALHTAKNEGPELLTPEATVYVPARGCRPPLLVSYGGAWVNECDTTPFVLPYFYGHWPISNPSSPWCFTPSFSTHILRLDTLEWAHLPGNSTGPDSPSPVAFNNSGIFGLGTFLAYDEARDRVLMLGASFLAEVTIMIREANVVVWRQLLRALFFSLQAASYRGSTQTQTWRWTCQCWQPAAAVGVLAVAAVVTLALVQMRQRAEEARATPCMTCSGGSSSTCHWASCSGGTPTPPLAAPCHLDSLQSTKSWIAACR
jgi:hypothetical protein